MLIVGIDWSKSKHDVVLMDPGGSVLQYLVVKHTLEGFETLAGAIERHESDPAEVRSVMANRGFVGKRRTERPRFMRRTIQTAPDGHFTLQLLVTKD